MEIVVKGNEIQLDKVTSILDDFVIDFSGVLKKLGIKHVYISGYVILLFGRQRITEDIDIFLEELDSTKLEKLYSSLLKDYWIINADSLDTAKKLYAEGIAWRVAKKGEISPNMEIKKPKSKLDWFTLNNPYRVILNKKHEISISPLELQIAYKMFLGSRKDLEDARFLYDLFKNKIEIGKVLHFANELKVSEEIRKAVL